VSKPHQLFDGTFFNDDLAKDLSPFGSLGKAVEQKRTKARTWIIDAALLDEVADMANGYVLENEAAPTGELIAKEWMARLLLATSGDQIIVLPYGNPDIELAKKLGMSAKALTKTEIEDWKLAQKIEAGMKSSKVSRSEVMKALGK
jgi:hypothetical protein